MCLQERDAAQRVWCHLRVSFDWRGHWCGRIAFLVRTARSVSVSVRQASPGKYCRFSTLGTSRNHSSWSTNAAGIAMAYISNWAYYAVLYSQVVKAVNRLLAVARPAFYRKNFTIPNTCKLLVVVWLTAALQCVVFLVSMCKGPTDWARMNF